MTQKIKVRPSKLHTIPFSASENTTFFTGQIQYPETVDEKEEYFEVVGVRNEDTEETFVLPIFVFLMMMQAYQDTQEMARKRGMN